MPRYLSWVEPLSEVRKKDGFGRRIVSPVLDMPNTRVSPGGSRHMAYLS